MDYQEFKENLLKVKKQLENDNLDEIPLFVRPSMPQFDYNDETYVVVSYSRKDFVEVFFFWNICIGKVIVFGTITVCKERTHG